MGKSSAKALVFLISGAALVACSNPFGATSHVGLNHRPGNSQDALYSSVVANFSMDGPASTTAIADTSWVQQPFQVLGVANLAAGISRFGGTSLYVNGLDTNAGVGFPSLTFGASDWCIEFWYYMPSAPAGAYPVFTNYNYYGGLTAAGIHIGVNSTPSLGLTVYTGGGNLNATAPNSSVNGLANFPVAQWVHVAAIRKGSAISLYLNGELQGSATLASNTGLNWESSNAYHLGRWAAFQLGAPMNVRYGYGYFSDLRITKGNSRYSGSFIPPTAAFPSY